MRAPFRVLAAAAVVALLAAGCTATPDPAPGAEDSATPSASSTSTPSQSQPPLPDGLTLSGVIEQDEPDGVPYARVTLADDHPALTVDPDLVSGDLLDAGYTTDQLQQMLQVAARYAVEEGLDSIVVDSDRTQEWLDANRGMFDPSYHAELEASVAMREEGAVMGGLVDNDAADVRESSFGYDLEYPAGGPRISDFVFEVVEQYLHEVDLPALTFRGYATRSVVLRTEDAVAEFEDSVAGRGSDAVPVELVCFTQTYGMTEHEGQWLISGWHNSFQYGADSELCQEIYPQD